MRPDISIYLIRKSNLFMNGKSYQNVWEDFNDAQKALQYIQHKGRNDICWCGSGEKYKRCHLDRAKESPLLIYDTVKVLRKFFNKGYCLHPEANLSSCNGPIVRAHTIQRRGGLNQIARNNHVYTFINESNISNNSFASPHLISIKKASTFTGFCKFHDNNTFEPIEKYPFQGTQEHTFLLSYRALCHEFFNKKVGLENVIPYQQRNLDRGKSVLDQYFIQEQLYYLKMGFVDSMRDVSRYKSAYDLSLKRHNFSDTYYYIIWLDTTPDFLCTGTVLPECSFDGRLLQRLLPHTLQLDHITFSLVATNAGGAAVFSWYGESRAGESLMKSLDNLSDQELPHAITRFAFETFENIFASPSWWDGLSNEMQQKLLVRQLSGMPSSDTARKVNCLMDDGVKVVNWNVTSRQTNLAL